MGLFSQDNKGKKLSIKEIHGALYGISGINKTERDIISDALKSENDMGGITEFELNRALRKLAREGTISRGHIKRIKNKLFD